MNKISTSLAASVVLIASGTAAADTSPPALLAGLTDSDISVIDDATQQNLRGEYINGGVLERAVKYFVHCSKSYIQCYGEEYISPTERFIKFSFRSTPTKTEYKSF